MKKVVFILMVMSLNQLFGQNEIIIHGASAIPGDSVMINIEISNSEPFISFQFDMVLPDSVIYCDQSLSLSDRRTNHVILGNMIGERTLRVFSYSPDNSPYLGSDGIIATFFIKVGNIRGEFLLEPSGAIIGNPSSQNILSGTQSGILSVFPQGLGEEDNDRQLRCRFFPNPFSLSLTLDLEMDQGADVSVRFIDLNGKTSGSINIGHLPAGFHEISLPPDILQSFSMVSGVIIAQVFADKRSGPNADYLVYKLMRR